MKILLPGLDSQVNLLLQKVDLTDKTIAIFGASSLPIAIKLLDKKAKKISIVIEDLELYLIDKINFENKFQNLIDKITIVNDEYLSFKGDDKFDIVYAQNSLTGSERNLILKNIKNLLTQDGILCIGEIVVLRSDIPKSFRDFFSTYSIAPLEADKFEKYFNERGFKTLAIGEDKYSLDKYYEEIANLFEKNKNNIFDFSNNPEKLIKRTKHDIDLYLKFGMKKITNFISGIFQL